jgi:hypothetical protein
MRKSEERRRGHLGLRVSLGLTIVVLLLFGRMSSGHGKARSKHKHSDSEPVAAQPVPAMASDARINAAYVFVKGAGILRLQDGTVSTVLQTQAALRDMQIDGEGALWASLRGTGVVRIVGGQTVTLSQESFAKLAIRSPIDVWTINDSHGNVVHYDGRRWKTVRTRNSLAGAFDDNRLLDIVTDGRAVWIAGWNGLWRVLGGRWTRLEPPPAVASNSEADSDGQSASAFPLSLLASKPGLIACYLAGCFVSTETDWQRSHWPTDKAHLQSAGAANLAAGTSADGTTVMVARLDGSGETSKSESLSATGINDIAIDPTGRVWVATGSELVVLDARGRTLQRWKASGASGRAGEQAGEIERVVISGAGPAQLPAQ